MSKKHCKICKKKLNDNNESGYCLLCFRKSPRYLEYQRLIQRIYSLTGKAKETKKKYREKNKDRIKKYQQKYHKDHKDKISKQKAESQKKRRLK